MYPTRILSGGSSYMQDDCILINVDFCFALFFTCCLRPGRLQLSRDFSASTSLFPSGGIHWFSVKGCTEGGKECFKRMVTHHNTKSTHCCYRHLCNLWASGSYATCLTHQSVSQPDLVIRGWQPPSIHQPSAKNLRPLPIVRSSDLKPILVFKFHPTNSNSSQKHSFQHHLSLVLFLFNSPSNNFRATKR